MSTLDLFTTDFPHGTREGYKRGCRGSACPNQNSDLMTCRIADGRYKSDYRYTRHLDAGGAWLERADLPSPEDAAAAVVELAQAGLTPEQIVGGALASTMKLAEAGSVESEAKQLEVVEPAPAAPTSSKRLPKGLPLDDPRFPHGELRGYQRGCNKEATCPGNPETGLTCNAAKRASSNAYNAAKRGETTTAVTPTAQTLTEAHTAPDDAAEALAATDEEFAVTAHPRPTTDIAGLLEDLGRARTDLQVALEENGALTDALMKAQDQERRSNAFAEERNRVIVEHEATIRRLQTALSTPSALTPRPQLTTPVVMAPPSADIVLEVGGQRITIAQATA